MVKPEVHQKQESPIDEGGTQPYQMRYRWVMLALIWSLYSVFGVVMRSISPLITPMLKDLNISYTQMGSILGSWPIAYIPVSLIGGAIMDRWGIRKALCFGIFVIGLSEILRYFPTGFLLMFLCVALFGVGGPMISIGGPKTIALWFRGKERGLAAGIYMTGPSIGGFVAYALTTSVVMPLAGYSWRLTFVYYSLLAFAAALVWWFLAKEVKPTEAAGESISMLKVFTSLIKLRNVQLILIMGFLSFVITHGFNDWMPKILEVSGMSPKMAGFAASISTVAAVPAAVTISPLTPPRLRKHLVAILSVVVAITQPVAVLISGAPLIVGLAIYGAATFAVFPLLLLILMDMPEIGAKYMGVAGGMFFCVSEIGGFGGPFILGALRDLSGNFFVGLFFLVALNLAMIVMALLLKTKPASDAKASP